MIAAPSISKIYSQFFCCLCYIHAPEIAMRYKKGPESFTLDNLACSNAAELLESTSLNLLDCQPSLRNKGLERSGGKQLGSPRSMRQEET